VWTKAIYFWQIELFGSVVCDKEVVAPVFDIGSSSVENFGRFVCLLNAVFLVGILGRQ
jgi:hypothetical protein